MPQGLFTALHNWSFWSDESKVRRAADAVHFTPDKTQKHVALMYSMFLYHHLHPLVFLVYIHDHMCMECVVCIQNKIKGTTAGQLCQCTKKATSSERPFHTAHQQNGERWDGVCLPTTTVRI